MRRCRYFDRQHSAYPLKVIALKKVTDKRSQFVGYPIPVRLLMGAVSSMVEHFVYTEGVRSSSLLPPKFFSSTYQIQDLRCVVV